MRSPATPSGFSWDLVAFSAETLSGGVAAPPGRGDHAGRGGSPWTGSRDAPPCPAGWGAPGEQDPALGKISVPHTITHTHTPPGGALLPPLIPVQPGAGAGRSKPAWAAGPEPWAGIPPGR